MKTTGNELSVLEAAALSRNKKALQEYAFLSQIADMYYNQNMQQSDIARQLFFSRSTVSRLLARAREVGIVDIRVRQVRDRIPSMEEVFCRTFGLKDAVIISCFERDSYDRTLDALTDFASIYTSNLLKGKKRFGIASGTAADRTIRKIHPIHECELEVVQLIGTASNAHQAVEARELRVHLAELFHGDSYELRTPIYMDNAMAREALLNDPNVRRVMDMMEHCDIVLTGLGGIDVSRLKTAEIIREYQTEAQAQELKEKGAVGCVCMMYYDINGNYVPCEWNEKCICLHLDKVRKNQMTVAVACGDHKIMTILGALRGHLPNVLITDVNTAAKVLSRNEELFGDSPEA
jgi:DNA-binding transcriptional regulator LsrR (DeoR family)